ncbi:MAG: MotA/TolQ/ExbB proton channel family protein [Cyclobacteriaceae bacterium]|nr:MotA/TolQ/ExbB proton channel family protein [Cyclobacteriaceae bacterium SS2]
MPELYMLLIYSLLFGWAAFSSYYIYRIWSKNNTNCVIPYVYDSIPSVFTTIGILGTFVGIYYGLKDFNEEQITESIPPLLRGLKTAFATSIWGISLSLVYGKVSQIVQRKVEKSSPPKPTGELGALVDILDEMKSSGSKVDTHFINLNKALIGDGDDSVSTHFIKLRSQIKEVEIALGGDGETSLLTQIQRLRSEQSDSLKALATKFDEFGEELKKNNTEALVEVMKKATEEFNAQMSELINKLVKENFEELNRSVDRMNQWQQDNKQMIQDLTNQFIKVSEQFENSSSAIESITINTKKLTDENSHLTKLIEELQKVLIEDKKFEEITEKLRSTVDTLKSNTDAFDETTNKLNEWVRNQMDFSDSVAKLLTRLEEIDRIKDINEVFWENTRKQLNGGVDIVNNATKRLSNELENINQEFYDRLNDTLANLDTLIQRVIENYRR